MTPPVAIVTADPTRKSSWFLAERDVTVVPLAVPLPLGMQTSHNVATVKIRVERLHHDGLHIAANGLSILQQKIVQLVPFESQMPEIRCCRPENVIINYV